MIVILLFLGGGLEDTLTSLSRPVGLGLFALLWLTSWFCTKRAVIALDLFTDRSRANSMYVFGISSWWGGVNGVLFFLPLAGVLIAILLVNSIAGGISLTALLAIVPATAFSIVVACVFAFFIGAIVGVLVGVIEVILFDIACLIAPGQTLALALDAEERGRIDPPRSV